MNKTIANLLIFGAGLAVGAGSTCFFWKKHYENRFEEDLKSVKEIWTYKKPEYVDRVDDPNPPKDDNGSPVEPAKELYTSAPREDVDYGTFYKNKEIDESEMSPLKNEKLEEEMAQKESPTERSKPYLISDEDYTDGEPGYDKVSCTFYVPDHVLVDDLSREVMEIDMVGDENIEFLIRSTDDIVFVRNDNISCDMEIMRSVDSIEEAGAQVWYG